MKKIQCIIIEDEPLAAEVLEDYIQAFPQLELKAICPDALYALEVLQREAIDLIFLDIHLPKLKGLDFIETLKNPPQIILTTAYHQYALKGYELDVVDYLLKPIEFNRFVKAINKVISKDIVSTLPPLNQLQPQKSPEKRFYFFNVNKKKVKIYLDEILYVESLKEYVKIYTPRQSILTKFQIGELEKHLNWNNLLRIHRSYLIAKDKIDAFSSAEIEVAGTSLPIGRSYKEMVLRELEDSFNFPKQA